MLIKQFDKVNEIVKVTFKIPETLASGAQKVILAGSFNDWNTAGKNPLIMQKLPYSFELQVELPMYTEFEYLYVIYETWSDKGPNIPSRWEMDWNADKYVPAPLGGSNSVVITFDFDSIL